MHPRTDFLRRSPLRRPYPRKHGVPLREADRNRESRYVQESRMHGMNRAETNGSDGRTAENSPVHEEADTAVGENTLLHRETLLVLATHDLEDIALELLHAQGEGGGMSIHDVEIQGKLFESRLPGAAA